jgi:probable addiction module antidote protein
MPKRTSDYHDGLLEELRDPRMAAHYLNAAYEDSPEMFLKALRNVAEARQMSSVARGAGISRESIYRMLSESGNPTYSSLLGILKSVGLRLVAQPLSVVGSVSPPIEGTTVLSGVGGMSTDATIDIEKESAGETGIIKDTLNVEFAPLFLVAAAANERDFYAESHS